MNIREASARLREAAVQIKKELTGVEDGNYWDVISLVSLYDEFEFECSNLNPEDSFHVDKISDDDISKLIEYMGQMHLEIEGATYSNLAIAVVKMLDEGKSIEEICSLGKYELIAEIDF